MVISHVEGTRSHPTQRSGTTDRFRGLLPLPSVGNGLNIDHPTNK